MSKKSPIAGSAKSRDDYEFLPAALEVLSMPPAPFGRIIAICIAAFFIIAIIWAWVGTVDVVAVSQGQTIPAGKVKVVQPLETGVVGAIHVEDGQYVEAGDLLIELDPTEAAANVEAIRFDLSRAKLDEAIATALLSENPVNDFHPPEGVANQFIQTSLLLLEDRLAKHKAALAAIDAEIIQAEAASRAATIEQTKLEQTIPLIEQRLEAQEGLLAKGLTQKPVVLSLRQEFIESQSALANTREQKAQSQATIETLKARRAEIIATFRATAIEEQRNALGQITANEQSLKKEAQRRIYRELRAPVTGTVQQLSIHTIGAVVNTADQLMIIVPDDMPLEIETMILNKDIGFVEEEQVVEIKLEAFPFTRYGTLSGRVLSLSRDAIIHEQLGPVYKAKIALDDQFIMIEGKQIRLSPGMNATAEIKTGKRRILEFFLSPLLRYRDEAIRER